MRWAHGERAVSFLPMKLKQLRKLALYPSARIALQIANESGEFARPIQPEQHMNVIFHAASTERGAILLAGNASQVGVSSPTDIGIRKEWASMFGGEDEVNVDLNEGLGHENGMRGDDAACDKVETGPGARRKRKA